MNITVCVCVRACMLSCFSNVRLFVTVWTVAHQAPLCMEFSGQKYWSGLPCPPPGDLPNPGIKPRSLALQEDSLPSEPPGKLPCVCMCVCVYIYTHIYGRRKWQPTPVFLPGESHGQRSLADYSPWGCKELDMTERLTHTHTHTHMTLVVKNVTASAGDIRDLGSIPGLARSPGGEHGTHSNILA